jgi:hypothetical protein
MLAMMAIGFATIPVGAGQSQYVDPDDYYDRPNPDADCQDKLQEHGMSMNEALSRRDSITALQQRR